MFAGSRADVDDPVALEDRVLVVFHHDHGVAEVAKPDERVDESAVVALVQTDRRFVEHVQGADETGTDLAGQANALSLATCKRARRSRQREVVEADVEQEAEACVDLLGDTLGDHPIALAEHQPAEELRRIADAHVAHLGDVLVVHPHCERCRLEAGAVARGARHEPHVTLVLLTTPVALGTLVAALDPRDHTLVGGAVLPGAPIPVLVLHLQVAGHAVQDDLLLLGGVRAVRRTEIDLVGLGHRFEHAREVLGVRTAPRCDRALVDAHVGVGDDEFRVDFEGGAQSVTYGAGTVRGVEREVARSELFVARATRRAHEVLTEGERLVVDPVAVDEFDLGDTFGETQRRLERIGEATLEAVAAHEPVDDDLDVVVLVAGQLLVTLEELVDVDGLAVDLGPHEPLAGEVLQQRVVVALAASHHRSEHLEAGALGKFEDAVDDLLRCLTLELGVVVGAVLHSDARPQQPEIVVDLRDRTHRGPRIAPGRLLIDRDRRRQPLDHIDIRFVHLAEELSGVGTQTLDVPSLALRVDGVERQAALAGAGQTGEHDQSVARQVDADVLEVVLACAANRDEP